MPTIAINLKFLLPPFLLVLVRVSGLTLSAPIFSSPGIPRHVKVGFVSVISLMITPIVFPLIPMQLTLGTVVAAVVGELIIGLVLGLGVSLVFLGARATGVIVGQQAGLSLGQVLNPMLNENSSIIDQLFYLVTLMVFLAVGGHRTLVATLLDTFHAIPPASFKFNASLPTVIETLITSAFQLAIRMSAPTLIALFMATLTMGFVSRTIPQLNILSVGFAVRVFVALTAAAVAMPFSFDLINGEFIKTFDLLREVFGLD